MPEMQANWPDTSELAEVLKLRAPDNDAIAIGPLQLQLWLGLREMARLRADSVALREKKLAAAYAALPKKTFDPFTTAGWAAGNISPDTCITWPSPNRFEPMVPPGATFPSLPTLIVSGDEDTNVPEEISRGLLAEFPSATFLIVAGAGHDAAVRVASG